MNSEWYVISRDLTHALTFVREARESRHPELVKQHLDEAERLIEHTLSIIGGVNAQPKAG